MINFIESGFVSSGDMLPYISLSKVSGALDTRDTCANRIERNIYQIDIYSDIFSELVTYVNDVENILDQSDLHVQNRRILSTQFNTKEITEPRPKIHRAKLQYEIIAQKDFSSSEYSFEFNDSDLSSTLQTKVENVTSTRFGHSSWTRPFIYVDGYETSDAFLTTKSRLESTLLTICVEEYSPFETERILEDIDNVLSYSRLKVLNRRWTTLEWQSSLLIEVEPGIWKGSIDYEVILEKDLVGTTTRNSSFSAGFDAGFN